MIYLILSILANFVFANLFKYIWLFFKPVIYLVLRIVADKLPGGAGELISRHSEDIQKSSLYLQMH